MIYKQNVKLRFYSKNLNKYIFNFEFLSYVFVYYTTFISNLRTMQRQNYEFYESNYNFLH
jgi:hypothetical protein